MNLQQLLLEEFAQETEKTRRVLERVPMERAEWKPHERSGTLGWLATHVATIPGWVTMILQQEEFDLAPPGGQPFRLEMARSRPELLARFQESAGRAQAALAGASEEQLARPWRLLRGGQPLLARPRIEVIREMVLNHLIHHRAQLCVYLRLNDVPVPSVYGPSADEDPFKPAA